MPTRELGPWLIVDRAPGCDRRVAPGGGARRRPDRLGRARRPGAGHQPESAETIYDVWAVREAVAGLPAEEREIVRLQHFGGLTHGEISEKLDMPIGTVKSRSFRAHKRLAAALGHLRE